MLDPIKPLIHALNVDIIRLKQATRGRPHDLATSPRAQSLLAWRQYNVTLLHMVQAHRRGRAHPYPRGVPKPANRADLNMAWALKTYAENGFTLDGVNYKLKDLVEAARAYDQARRSAAAQREPQEAHAGSDRQADPEAQLAVAALHA